MYIFTLSSWCALSPWCIKCARTRTDWMDGARYEILESIYSSSCPYVLFFKIQIQYQQHIDGKIIIIKHFPKPKAKAKSWCRINERNRFSPFHQLVDISLTIAKLLGNRIWLTLSISPIFFFLVCKNIHPKCK